MWPRLRSAMASPTRCPRGGRARGGRRRSRLVIAPEPWGDQIPTAARPVLESGRTVMVVVPTIPEAEALAGSLQSRLGPPVEAMSSTLGGGAGAAGWGGG